MELENAQLNSNSSRTSCGRGLIPGRRIKTPGIKTPGIKTPGIKTPGIKTPGIKVQGVWLLLLLAVSACSSRKNNDTTATSGVGGAGGATMGTGGAGGSIPVTQKCELPDDAQPLDPLTLLQSAQGPSFIEILDVVQADPVVYGCTSVKGLSVWDADSGANLAISIAPPGLSGGGTKALPHCQHVALDDGRTKVAITNRGDEIQPQPFIHIFDVTTPAAPVALGGWTGSESIEGVAWHGSTLFAAAHSAGVIAFNVDEAGTLTETGRFKDDNSDAWQVVYREPYLFSAEGTQGMRVYRIAEGGVTAVANVPITGSSKDIVLQNDVAYVAASSHVAAIDIRLPEKPELISEVKTAGTAVALAVGHNHTLLVAEWDKLVGYDTSNPYALKREFSEVLPSSASYSRILSIDADPERQKVYAGEWSRLHYYKQEDCGVGPDIETSPTHLSFPTLPADKTDERILTVTNHGNRDLEVSKVETNSDYISFDTSPFTLAPGATQDLIVTFAPVNSEPLNAGMRLLSNDLDQNPLRLSISGNVVGVGEGDPLPSFSLQDTEGTTYSTENLKGQVVLLAYFATF